MKKYPTLYALSPNGEASGEVFHFCSYTCLTAFVGDLHDFHAGTHALGEDTENEILDDELCTQCARVIG